MPMTKCHYCGKMFNLNKLQFRPWPICPECEAKEKLEKRVSEMERSSANASASSSSSSSSAGGSALYWLIIGWWLAPTIWFIKFYLGMWKTHPKATVVGTVVFVVFAFVYQAVHKSTMERELATVRTSITIPDSQKLFVQRWLDDQNAIEKAEYSIRDSLAKTKLQETLFGATGGAAVVGWEGTLEHLTSESSMGNLGFQIRIAGTEVIFRNYQVIPTFTDPYLVPKGSDVYRSLSAIRTSSIVTFSGYIINQAGLSDSSGVIGFKLTSIQVKSGQ